MQINIDDVNDELRGKIMDDGDFFERYIPGLGKLIIADSDSIRETMGAVMNMGADRLMTLEDAAYIRMVDINKMSDWKKSFFCSNVCVVQEALLYVPENRYLLLRNSNLISNQELNSISTGGLKIEDFLNKIGKDKYLEIGDTFKVSNNALGEDTRTKWMFGEEMAEKYGSMLIKLGIKEIGFYLDKIEYSPLPGWASSRTCRHHMASFENKLKTASLEPLRIGSLEYASSIYHYYGGRRQNIVIGVCLDSSLNKSQQNKYIKDFKIIDDKILGEIKDLRVMGDKHIFNDDELEFFSDALYSHYTDARRLKYNENEYASDRAKQNSDTRRVKSILDANLEGVLLCSPKTGDIYMVFDWSTDRNKSFTNVIDLKTDSLMKIESLLYYDVDYPARMGYCTKDLDFHVSKCMYKDCELQKITTNFNEYYMLGRTRLSFLSDSAFRDAFRSSIATIDVDSMASVEELKEPEMIVHYKFRDHIRAEIAQIDRDMAAKKKYDSYVKMLEANGQVYTDSKGCKWDLSRFKSPEEPVVEPVYFDDSGLRIGSSEYYKEKYGYDHIDVLDYFVDYFMEGYVDMNYPPRHSENPGPTSYTGNYSDDDPIEI